MTNITPDELSDRELLDRTTRVASHERQTTAELLALLAELDSRRLYLGEGYSSLFSYCTQALRLSEPAAYSRITAARAARRFPVILTLVAAGDLTLRSVGLLAPHLADENVEGLLDAARHKSKREVEHLVACLVPQPDIQSSLRRLPQPGQRDTSSCSNHLHLGPAVAPEPRRLGIMDRAEPSERPARSSARPLVVPIAPERYLMRITIGRETHDKLERARDLLRHTMPDGDPAAIVDRALTVLLEALERTKVGATTRPRLERGRATARSRHVSAAVRRIVWTRDGGRCAFVGTQGRCVETGFLEFHHVRPFAAGGATNADNLQLRCRAHNALEAERDFGVATRARHEAAPPP